MSLAIRRRRARRGRAGPGWAEHHTPGAQNLRQPGPQAHAELSRVVIAATTSAPWPSGWKWTRRKFASWGRKACSCARWSPHPAQNGRFWRAQFCTEVARSERFELPTLGIEIRCSIQLSYERVRPADYQTWPGRASSGMSVAGVPPAVLADIGRRALAAEDGGGTVVIGEGTGPVSYTHLTLPTKRIV